MNTNTLTPGRYRHYKGNEYEVIGIGRDTETEVDVVIYRPCYDSDVAYWVRPYLMFIETVEIDGIATPRFERIGVAE